MAYGKDVVNWPKERPVYEYDDEEPEEIDRFEERKQRYFLTFFNLLTLFNFFDECIIVKAEVNERVEFLDDMAKVGRRKEYQNHIMTEISQKIREMEILDKQRTAELNEMIKAKTNS